MLRMTWALAALAALWAQGAAAAPAADPAAVVAAERAFAARAAEAGIAPSFLAFMADEAIAFAPGPVSAKAVYGGRPPGKAPKDGGTLLAWWPNFAGVSRSGDLGFTTGPAALNGKPMGICYFTIWARQPDGGWKWVMDGGGEADVTGAAGPEAEPLALPPGDARPMAPALAWAQVQARETALARAAATDSAGAIRTALAPGARLLGAKAAPGDLDRQLAGRAHAIAYRLVGGGAAKAGDLVWTWGEAAWPTADGQGGRTHFVRVWQRREGRWALVFDELT